MESQVRLGSVMGFVSSMFAVRHRGTSSFASFSKACVSLPFLFRGAGCALRGSSARVSRKCCFSSDSVRSSEPVLTPKLSGKLAKCRCGGSLKPFRISVSRLPK